ncbi:hypothetical protein SAMN05518672_102374 [Chitinophaga sp. CF118]|uniref:hypothetical protein n=1 Tax=Chitinophaga sp. CF118 TaxID=1884367 RepID=UPI0008EE71D9|nr:hypothetical protein [Chitinophaga sp. CF118]SFD54570.1 hypothetical protein SAMN05518672_102374 [Chitinophaga sp. CF118]
MGYLIYLLKNWEKHSAQKMVRDIAEVAFNANFFFEYKNDKEYFPDGKFSHLSVFIADDFFSVNYDKQNKCFVLEIQGVNPGGISSGSIQKFDFLKPGENLCNLASIKDLNEEAYELFYRFCYEYLRLNPDEYFWFDLSKWVYGWEEMQRLSKYPYDKDWLFKDPGLLE